MLNNVDYAFYNVCYNEFRSQFTSAVILLASLKAEMTVRRSCYVLGSGVRVMVFRL